MGVSSRARPRQRTSKACTRCRIKKIKCDGGSPCCSCKFQDTMCHYAERAHRGPRQVPSGYVEHLEQQREFLVLVLKELWKTQATTSSSEATSSRDGDHIPTLHEIIADFGVEIDVPDDLFLSKANSDTIMRGVSSPSSEESGSNHSRSTLTPEGDPAVGFNFDSSYFQQEPLSSSYPVTLDSSLPRSPTFLVSGLPHDDGSLRRTTASGNGTEDSFGQVPYLDGQFPWDFDAPENTISPITLMQHAD